MNKQNADGKQLKAKCGRKMAVKKRFRSENAITALNNVFNYVMRRRAK